MDAMTDTTLYSADDVSIAECQVSYKYTVLFGTGLMGSYSPVRVPVQDSVRINGRNINTFTLRTY